ncbi:Wzz/FepE/Etk N-terminal domain-containing protein [Legionella fallonii]|uniref:Putative O-antigen chain length regulator n=1 Tax=Legionella fallonii LLAP-10 TaxID=1212491 RepID=A0A098G2N0_9GAMM|nr:Wzz/FepE/Etk N-terminal domain-containing protein [Legionella fallonii]CEG56241.1 putative O-antigen chain length regulator [Legionella fallonii LLAP-10]
MSGNLNSVRDRLFKNNELNLNEFFRIIWNQKWLVSFIMLVSILIGITFIKLSRPIYEAKAIIAPPNLSEVSSFNAGRSMQKYDLLQPFERREIYTIFKENFESQLTRDIFFNSLAVKQNSAKTALINSTKHYTPIVSTGVVEKKLFGKRFVTVRYTDPQMAAELAKRYVAIANQNAFNELLNIIKTQSNTVVNDLQSRIRAAQLVLKEQDKEKNNGLNKDQLLLENARIREMQENIELYKAPQVIETGLLYHLDGEVIVPTAPVSPRKSAILFLSVVLGFILGSGSAVLKAFLTERKNIL